MFVLLVLTVSKASSAELTQQCSIQQPAGGSSALDFQQVTTMPYCVIDDCTIENYETGQQLDIIYTTDSLLVVTLRGNQTSMVVINKSNK